MYPSIQCVVQTHHTVAVRHGNVFEEASKHVDLLVRQVQLQGRQLRFDLLPRNNRPRENSERFRTREDWARKKVGVPEENGLLEQLKNGSYQIWARRKSEGLVMDVREGEIECKCLAGRRRAVWIDDVR